MDWRETEPRKWNTLQYVSYMKDIGLEDIYYDFYNSTFIEKTDDGLKKKSLGFRSCSIDRSLAWALETKFLFHKCKVKEHTGQKHSKLDFRYPVATYVCPLGGGESTAPIRWKEYKRWVPIDFKSKEDLISMAKKTRTWFWELTLLHNNFRDMEMYPVKAIGRRISVEEYDMQWNRVISHPYIIEVDASQESNMKGRRDLLEKDKYLEEAMYFIEKVNDHIILDLGIDLKDFEWWFSGNGLYCILNPWLNSFIGSEGDLGGYFKKNLAFWNNHIDILKEKMDKEVRYVKIDNKPQHLRSYIKTPFSLHQDYDRICIPLTPLFGENGKIDLMGELFRKMILPKNLSREVIEKYFIEDGIDGMRINNFLKVYRLR